MFGIPHFIDSKLILGKMQIFY